MMKFIVVCLWCVIGAAAVAEANHESHFMVFNGYAVKSSEAASAHGGLFVGGLWGLIGLEYAELEGGDGMPVLFRGLSSQPVILPMGEPGGIMVMPVRWAISLGTLDRAFGGRIGFDLIYQFDRYEVYNIFGGMSHWMNIDGLRITAAQIGFGF